MTRPSNSNSSTPLEPGGDTRFVGEPLDTSFGENPGLQKTPVCPERFVWRGAKYRVTALLAEWRNYSGLPRKAPSSLAHGSWGVGRSYFRVQTDTGHVFDIYYDRKPHGPGGRKGSWFLFREVVNLPE